MLCMPDAFDIIVNGFPEAVPAGTTLADLTTTHKEGDVDLIVEHNGRFVYPAQYAHTGLSAGDRVEFINPNFGG